MRLVALEKEEVIGPLLLDQMLTVGFDGVRRVRDHQHTRQIHLRQVRGHRRLFVGVARHGDLIDQSLLRRLEVHQRQRLLRFGFLLVHRGIDEGGRLDQGRLLLQTRRGRIGVTQHLPIQVQDLDRFRI